MARTDVAEVRANVKESAENALDTVRSQAASAGESLSAVVSAALDTAAKEGKKASRDAGKKAQKRVQDLTATVQEKTGRKPRRGRKVLVVGGVALAGVAVMTVVSKKKAQAQQSELPGDRPSYQ